MSLAIVHWGALFCVWQSTCQLGSVSAPGHWQNEGALVPGVAWAFPRLLPMYELKLMPLVRNAGHTWLVVPQLPPEPMIVQRMHGAVLPRGSRTRAGTAAVVAFMSHASPWYWAWKWPM